VNVDGDVNKPQSRRMSWAPRLPKDLISLEERVSRHAPHLARVSRSFAFGISRLQLPLQASVGLGYLVCRLLDTVEDAHWTLGDDQERAFREFETFVSQTSFSVTDRDKVRAWAARFPTGISEGERLLIDEAVDIFAEFASLNSSERAALLDPVLSMSRGMAHFTKDIRKLGSLRLTTLQDVNVYCFFVAGVVGELLTGLVNEEFKPIGLESVWSLATHFGLFLQKVNVLKDQWGDEREGRYLVPDRDVLLESLHENATGAFDYLRSISLGRKDYRLFCAWALFLGLATVPPIRESKAGGEPAKISRLQSLAISAKIELAILDNSKLEELFEDLMQGAWPDHSTSIAGVEPSPQTLSVLSDCYRGRVDVRELARLLARL
jgi:phytoene/squalene synthetase